MEQEEMMWKYVDGLCSPTEIAQIEQWKKEQPGFSKELELLMGIHNATATAMVVEAPKGFTQKVTRQIRSKFSFLPFLNQTISTRSILPWAIGISLLAMLFAAQSLIDPSIVEETSTSLPDAPSFFTNLSSSSLFWIVACFTFFIGLDRFLHHKFIKEEVKKSL